MSKQLGRTPADLALDTEMITTARQNLQKEFGTVAFQMDTPTQQKYLAAMAKLQAEVTEKFTSWAWRRLRVRRSGLN